MGLIQIKNLRGGLNLSEPTSLQDNEFEVLDNMLYNTDKRLQSSKGIKIFANQIGNKPISSYFYYKNTATGERIALCTSGTQMYKLNTTTNIWGSIKTGLTEFEADGITRTVWSFTVLNNKIYMCNGVNNYAEYDGTTYTEFPAQPKVRYLVFLADAIRGAGEDIAPNVLYITNALGATAADGRTLNANQLNVGGDERGRINGIEELQSSVLAFKDNTIYNISGSLTTAKTLDSENGGYGNNAIKRVGNSLVYFNNRGFNTLRAKNTSIGANALENKPLGDNIKELTDKVKNFSFNYTIGYYSSKDTNYYCSFDTNGGSTPNETLVYSSLVAGWSKLTLPAHTQFGLYEDDNGDIVELISSGNTGQMYQINTGYDNLGGTIDCELKTKRFDLGDNTLNKTFTSINLIGLKSKGDALEVNIIAEGEIIGGGQVTDDYITDTSISNIGVTGGQPIGTLSNAGGSTKSSINNLDMYKYYIRFPLYELSTDIQIQIKSSSTNLSWTLDRISLTANNEDIILFQYGNLG